MVSVSAKGQTELVNSLHSSRQKRKGRLSRLLQRILPALLLLSLWTPAGFAADIMVMTAEDRLDAAFATFDPTTNWCGMVVDSAAFPAEPSLREALIYANHTDEPDTITFAPDLSGQTIMISFDGSDEGEQADPLPTLCGSAITLNGDVNGDGMPDITLDGSNFPPDDAFGYTWGFFVTSDNNTINGLTLHNFPNFGIAVYHNSSFGTASMTGNRVTNNTVVGGQLGILIQAGFGTAAGTVQDTTISGNRVSEVATFDGIFVGTGSASGSSIDDTRITDNVVRNNNRLGIFILANFDPAGGSDTTITNTTIQNNEVFENNNTGIAAYSFFAANSRITDLHILDNHVYDHPNGLGISVVGGVCGATGNTMEAEIARNTLSGNELGIFAGGGSNFGCTGEEPFPPASQNNLTVAITQNTLEDELSGGIAIYGGLVDGNTNTVDATVTGNTVLRSGDYGIDVSGAAANYLDDSDMEVSGAVANANTVTATLANNRVEGGARWGLAFSAAASGAASANMVEVAVQNNFVCGNDESDIFGQGGWVGDDTLSANSGTGNALTVTLTDNSAGSVNVEDGVAGNTAMLTESGTQPCGRRALENPQPDSSQSGIGVISGWVCEADKIEVEFENGVTGERSIMTAGYGTSRGDTAMVCEDDGNNGFSLLYNWNMLGDGMHMVRALADGVEFARGSVMVSTLGLGEMPTGLSGAYPLADFPTMGQETMIQWEESLQNFVITAGAGGGGGSCGAAPQMLENPQPGSFQSGIGVISGWVCEAEEITIEFEHGVTGEVSSTTAGYGTSRDDTMEACGDANNGFSLLFNWNLLGAGMHTVRTLADGEEFANVTFTVSTLGLEATEFATGLSGEFMLDGFPGAGQETTVEWEQSLQNFVITGVEPTETTE